MNTRTAGNRPWLSALLGSVVTGLGHLYLREWVRAATWIGLVFAAWLLFVPEATRTVVLDAPLNPFSPAGVNVDPINILPIVAVQLLSVLDAYRIASVRSIQFDESRCPYCGKTLDTELDFCQWCTQPLPEMGSEESDSPASR